MTDLENDYALPIDSYAEQLLPSNNAFIFSQEDEDFKRILELSRKEFEENHIYNKDYFGSLAQAPDSARNLNFLEIPSLDSIENDKIKLENIEPELIEEERIELVRIEQERIELSRIELSRIELVRIELARNEQERIELARNEQERIELARIEQENIDKLKLERRNSLLNFSNRINKLIHIKEDKKIKELIDNILEKYFNLEIDNFKLNKKDYIGLYKIIDSYYEIPSSKNLKTAITKEENELVKNIFLESFASS